MKSDLVYDRHERRQSADRMEAVMIITSATGVFAAIMALAIYGWLPSLALILFSVIAFALSRVFDLLSGLIGSMGRIEEIQKTSRPEKSDNAGS